MKETTAIKNEGLGIFAKLMSGFLLVLLLTGIGDYYSFTQMNRLSSLTTKIYNHPLQVTRAVLSADTNIVKIHRSMKDVALARSDKELETAISRVNDYEKIVYSYLEIVRKRILGNEGAALQKETAQLFHDWKPIRDEVIALTRRGNIEEAFAITKGKGADHVEKLNLKMEELKNYAAEKASGMLHDSQLTRVSVIRTTTVFIALIVTVAIIFGFFFSRSVTNTINSIINGIQEFAKGNLEFEIKTESKDELSWIAKALNKMAFQRKKILDELSLQSEILKNMAEGVYLIKAEDGIIVHANPKFENMFGYNPGELNGKHVSIVNAPTSKDPGAVTGEIMKEVSNSGAWSGEVRNIKKDGTTFWCNANVSLFDHPTFGQVMISVHTDVTKRKSLEKKIKDYQINLEETVKARTVELEKEITERKLVEEKINASLKEKETLLLEIHHRVKNNMQVISSLLKLQSNSFNDDKIKKALLESQNRVRAMASVHKNLYKSNNLSSINLLPFLKELVESILVSYQTNSSKIALEFKADDIVISIDQATPIGLIVNELVSNSLKYAFPDRHNGTIRINITHNNGEVHLHFSDDGIGMPQSIDWRDPDTLGLQLVANLAENQLHGSIKMESNNGTHFIVIFEENPGLKV